MYLSRNFKRILTAAFILVTLIGCGAERRGRYVEVAELSYPGDYWQPSGVAINDEDTVAVADISEMSVVHLFDGSGVLYATIGRMGKEPGELFVPVDAAFGPDGNLYVAEFGTKRVSVFEPDGVFLRVFGEDVLETPFGVAAGAGDTVYVVNADPPELLVFGTGGEIKDRWGERLGLVGPEDVAYRDGRLAVVDSAGGRVIVTDGDGNVLHEVVPLGDPAPMPVEAAWEPEGRLFVLARGRANEEERALVSCVLVYDEDGKLLERVDVDLPSPGALAVDSHGGIFIADGPAHSVKVYARREVEG